MYHRVAARSSRRMRPFTVDPAAFEAQLAFLRREGYRGLTVSDLVARTGNGLALPEKPVVLTFDDGFADFHADAVPLLRKYGFPATLYMVAGEIGGSASWLTGADRHLPLLTSAELVELDGAGIEIGAHSMTHPALDLLAPAALESEVRGSKARLEEVLGHPVLSFCYPFGFADGRVRAAAKAAGFASACSVRYRTFLTGDDPFDLPRHIVRGGAGLGEFASIVGGHPAIAPMLWDRLRAGLGSAARHWAGQTLARSK